MFTPSAPELIVGKVYFCCSYFLEKLPVPDVETWIYLGADIYGRKQGSKIGYHYFERPEVYYSDQIAKENQRFIENVPDEEDETSCRDARMRISETELDGLIYDYVTFRDWVNQLNEEPNAENIL